MVTTSSRSVRGPAPIAPACQRSSSSRGKSCGSTSTSSAPRRHRGHDRGIAAARALDLHRLGDSSRSRPSEAAASSSTSGVRSASWPRARADGVRRRRPGSAPRRRRAADRPSRAPPRAGCGPRGRTLPGSGRAGAQLGVGTVGDLGGAGLDEAADPPVQQRHVDRPALGDRGGSAAAEDLEHGSDPRVATRRLDRPGLRGAVAAPRRSAAPLGGGPARGRPLGVGHGAQPPPTRGRLGVGVRGRLRSIPASLLCPGEVACGRRPGCRHASLPESMASP